MAVNIAAVDPGIDNPYWLSDGLARRIRSTFAGGTPDEVPDRYAEIRAANWLHPSAPPTLLTYGTNDWLVPAIGSLEYAGHARAHGVEVDTVAIPSTGHLIGLSGAARRAIIDLTVDWFDRHRP